MSYPDEILRFWYSELASKHWFNSTPDIDQLIRDRYESLWYRAIEGEFDSWANNAESCLALILLFDQFPLNMFRGKVESFATESRAVGLTLQGIEKGFDAVLPQSRLSFFYMPLMHSENMQHQDMSVASFERAGLENNARFARHHRHIIEQFGRFPHRNEILGRSSTQAELDYLNSERAFKG